VAHSAIAPCFAFRITFKQIKTGSQLSRAREQAEIQPTRSLTVGALL